MKRFDRTLDTPELNLALDEALLDDSAESLRFWEAPSPVVVLGRSSRLAVEANAPACEAAGAPIRRRVSGGAAIVAGPGCLMYAVTLGVDTAGKGADLNAIHRRVLGRVRDALASLGHRVAIAGTSDLAIDNAGRLRKFSGNSLRVVRNRLLYHGTLLYGFDLSLIGRYLLTPPRQPEYRDARPHEDFVTNLAADRGELVRALTDEWDAEPADLPDRFVARANRLVEEKYSDPAWNAAR